jgi:hypothetical protein
MHSTKRLAMTGDGRFFDDRNKIGEDENVQAPVQFACTRAEVVKAEVQSMTSLRVACKANGGDASTVRGYTGGDASSYDWRR